MKRFYVQERPLEAWHVETEEDCERMLCGAWISVESEQSKVQRRWGPRKCPDCWIILKRLEADMGARVVPGASVDDDDGGVD